MVELMTITLNGNVAFPSSLHIRLIMLPTPMGPLVKEEETGVQLQLSLENPPSSLM